jgi:HAD superfamily hydrolase (TIGR01509 family)
MQQKLNKLNQLSAGDYDAFLYDCDGTLADTMPWHKKAYVTVAADAGVHIDGNIIDELAGLPVINVIQEINKRYQSNFDPVAFADEKEALFFDQYIDAIQPIDFVAAHMRAHHGSIKMAVVSGGVRSSVQKTLQVVGLDTLTNVLVCAGETERGKPYPDPFLKAAELLGVAPQRCLVFEDGASGVQAAIAAGMQWIRVDQL